MTVSERLRAQIELCGLSYGELADKTGLAKSALHRYATGQTDKIPIDAIERIAPVLGVTPSYLLGWEPRPHTLAAHFEGEEFTAEELSEIEDFVRFVKSRRKT